MRLLAQKASGFFTCLAAAALLLSCGEGSGTDSEDAAPTPLLTGYVEAELVYVAAPSSGWLISSAVREGDRVKPGDLLFELEADLQNAQLQEATNRLRQTEAQTRDLETGARQQEIAALQSQLNEATANLELTTLALRRQSSLAEQGIVSQDNADRAIADQKAAQARVATLEANIAVARLGGRTAAQEAALATASVAEAQVREARWHLDQRRVVARISGRVEELFHREGEFVPTASPVLALLPEASLEVRFFVPQSDLHRVSPGSSVAVLVDGRPEPTEARVSYVARQAEFTPPVIYSTESREKLVFLVRALLEDPAGLRPGQPVDVRLP